MSSPVPFYLWTAALLGIGWFLYRNGPPSNWPKVFVSLANSVFAVPGPPASGFRRFLDLRHAEVRRRFSVRQDITGPAQRQ
jgi:hypothetical protein